MNWTQEDVVAAIERHEKALTDQGLTLLGLLNNAPVIIEKAAQFETSIKSLDLLVHQNHVSLARAHNRMEERLKDMETRLKKLEELTIDIPKLTLQVELLVQKKTLQQSIDEKLNIILEALKSTNNPLC